MNARRWTCASRTEISRLLAEETPTGHCLKRLLTGRFQCSQYNCASVSCGARFEVKLKDGQFVVRRIIDHSQHPVVIPIHMYEPPRLEVCVKDALTFVARHPRRFSSVQKAFLKSYTAKHGNDFDEAKIQQIETVIGKSPSIQIGFQEIPPFRQEALEQTQDRNTVFSFPSENLLLRSCSQLNNFFDWID